MTVNLRNQDGVGGPFPKNRIATGTLLATRTLEFTVIEPSLSIVGGRQSVIGTPQFTGVGPSHGSLESAVNSKQWAEVSPNPISNTMRLKISEAKGQSVNVSLLDASGRTMLQRNFVPDTNQHQEEFEVSQLTNGMYFLQVTTAEQHTTLKLIKID